MSFNSYFESVQAHFLQLRSYRRFPSDEEFKRELRIRDIYNFQRCAYMLRRLENDGRKEHVPVDEYTIEHILPQNDNLFSKWREDLGPDWQRIQETWLHTLGNLTLTGYNTEYSDRFFIEKRDMPGGFKQSPLRLNEGLGILDTWNETTIQSRADRLANMAVTIWRAPKLPADILDVYELETDELTNKNRKINHDQFVQLIRTAPSVEWISDYFDLMNVLIGSLGLQNGDPRLVTSIPQSKKWFLPVTINNRYVLVAEKHEGEIYIAIIFGPVYEAMSELKASTTISWHFSPLTLYGENIAEVPYFIRFSNARNILESTEIRDYWLDAVRSEINRARSSPYHKFHQPIVYEAATNLDYRNQLLNQAFFQR